jgi:hypothetical protein
MRGRRSIKRAAALGSIAAIGLLDVGFAGADAPARGLSIDPPHHVRKSAATLDLALTREVYAEVVDADVRSTRDAIELALRITGRHLTFGLSHRTSLAFGVTDREANCVEYAHLFAKIFDFVQRKGQLGARAYEVHSDKASFFGIRIAFRGLGEHDWALVVDRNGQRTFVDPTFADAGLDWDIHSNVHGELSVP